MAEFKKVRLQKKEKRYQVTFDKFVFTDKDEENSAKRLSVRLGTNCVFREGAVGMGVGSEQYVRYGNAMPKHEEKEIRKFLMVDTAETLDDEAQEQLHCITADGILYSYEDASLTYTHQIPVSVDANMVCVADEYGEKRTILSGEGGYWTRVDGSWMEYTLGGATTAICVCKNRVFIALHKATLAYSDPSTPWSFDSTVDGGGRIRLPYEFGEIVALLTFENKVYAFHQFGVARVDVEGDAEDFKTQPLDHVGGEIYGRSVGVCGNMIFFLAADGVYRFDGKKSYRVETEIDILPSSTVKDCSFAVFKEKYIVQYTDVDGEIRCVAAANSENAYFTDERQALSQCGSRGLFCLGDFVHTFKEKGGIYVTEGIFSTQKTDFGVRGKKTLRALRVKGRGSVLMSVLGDGFEKSETLDLKDGDACMDLRKLGESFYFTFTLSGDACVRSITVDFSVTNG